MHLRVATAAESLVHRDAWGRRYDSSTSFASSPRTSRMSTGSARMRGGAAIMRVGEQGCMGEARGGGGGSGGGGQTQLLKGRTSSFQGNNERDLGARDMAAGVLYLTFDLQEISPSF